MCRHSDIRVTFGSFVCQIWQIFAGFNLLSSFLIAVFASAFKISFQFNTLQYNIKEPYKSLSLKPSCGVFKHFFIVSSLVSTGTVRSGWRGTRTVTSARSGTGTPSPRTSSCTSTPGSIRWEKYTFLKWYYIYINKIDKPPIWAGLETIFYKSGKRLVVKMEFGVKRRCCGHTIGWSDFFWSDRRRHLTKGQAWF